MKKIERANLHINKIGEISFDLLQTLKHSEKPDPALVNALKEILKRSVDASWALNGLVEIRNRGK